MTITNTQIDAAVPVSGTPSRALVNALLKTLVAEQQADFRVTVPGRYYPILDNAAVAAGSGGTAGTVYFTPFFIRETTSISELVTRIATLSATGLIQLAVYGSDPATGLPTGAPLAQTGDLSAAVATTVSGTVTPVTLAPGLYYFALMGNDSTLRWVSIAASGGVAVSAVTGTLTASALLSSSTSAALSVTLAGQTFGVWPTNPTVTVAGQTTSAMPFGGYRVTP